MVYTYFEYGQIKSTIAINSIHDSLVVIVAANRTMVFYILNKDNIDKCIDFIFRLLLVVAYRVATYCGRCEETIRNSSKVRECMQFYSCNETLLRSKTYKTHSKEVN
jgi:hypothetical protein